MDAGDRVGLTWMQNEAVYVVLEDFPDDVALSNVVGDGPWHGQSCRHFKCTSNMQDFCEEKLDAGLDCCAHAYIEDAEADDGVPLRRTLANSGNLETARPCWEAVGILDFDIDGQRWQDAIEDEEQ